MISLVANHLWQSTLFAVLIGMLVLVLRKNGARLRYWLWMAASLKFLLPFSLLVALGSQLGQRIEWRPAANESVAVDTTDQWTNIATAVVQPAGAPPSEYVAANASGAAGSPFDIESIALSVWLLGAIAVLSSWCFRWLRLEVLLRRATVLSKHELRGFQFPVPVLSADGRIEPGIVGIAKQVLLVPKGLFERLSDQQIRAILAHERCHLERRDNLTAAVHMFVEAVFWFHPVIWWIGARLIEERELACDAAVLKAGNDPETYASGILDVCQHYVAAELDCVSGVSGADLKKRVRSIMTHTGEARVHLAKGALIVSISLAVIAVPIAFGAITTARAQATVESSDSADTADEWPTIDSSSMELSQMEEGPNRSLLISPNGTFSTRNWSLRGVIAWAYGVQTTQIDAPNARLSDLATNRYNIIAKSSELAISKVAEEREAQRRFTLMVRRLLDEKFRLRYHWETVRAPVYVLTLSVPALGPKVARSGDPGPTQRLGVNSLRGSAAPLRQPTQYLANELGRPVIDQTGLTERYNYTIKWGPEPGDPGMPNNPDTPLPINTPTKEQLMAALQSQLGLTLTSQAGDVKKMVVDHLEQPADLTPSPVEVKLSDEIFDRYVGYYDFPYNGILEITREGSNYFARPTGQRPLQLFASGQREFFAKQIDAKASFRVDDAGNAMQLVLTQGGRETVAPRLQAATAIERIAALKARIRDKTPQPRSEELLRKYFQSLRDDAPAYELMTDDVAKAVRAEWPNVKTRYDQLGKVRSIDLKSVDPGGADIYTVTFDNGKSEWRIGLNQIGKVDRLNYRRLADS